MRGETHLHVAYLSKGADGMEWIEHLNNAMNSAQKTGN
jgi:hypothetical protein